MTAARGPADIVTTLIKILRAEQKRGFDDRAIAGGLDRYLRGALAEADTQSPLYRVVAALPRDGYGSLETGQREAWAKTAIKMLNSTPVLSKTPTQAPPITAEPPSGPRRAIVRGASPSKKITAEKRETREASGGQADTRADQSSQPSSGLQASVGTLARIQQTTVNRLTRIGIETVEDLLWHFPNRHVDFTDVKPIANLFVGQRATVVGTIKKSRVAFFGRGRRATEITIADETGSIRVLWFNQPYLAKQFVEGARIGLAGNVTANRKRPQLTSPE